MCITPTKEMDNKMAEAYAQSTGDTAGRYPRGSEKPRNEWSQVVSTTDDGELEDGGGDQHKPTGAMPHQLRLRNRHCAKASPH